MPARIPCSTGLLGSSDGVNDDAANSRAPTVPPHWYLGSRRRRGGCSTVRSCSLLRATSVIVVPVSRGSVATGCARSVAPGRHERRDVTYGRSTDPGRPVLLLGKGHRPTVSGGRGRT